MPRTGVDKGVVGVGGVGVGLIVAASVVGVSASLTSISFIVSASSSGCESTMPITSTTPIVCSDLVGGL